MKEKLSVQVDYDLARQRVIIGVLARQGALKYNKTYEFSKQTLAGFHPGVADLYAESFQKDLVSRGFII